MPTPPPLRRAAALALVAALVVAPLACASSDDDAGPRSTTSTAPRSTTVAGDDGPPDTVDDEVADATEADYVAALEARVELSMVVDRILESTDVLVTPTLPLDAFEAGRNVPRGWSDDRWMTWTPFTYPFNITGHPAISVPCGVSDRGLPVGLQLVGRKFEDGRLLGLAAALEQVLPVISPPGW